MPPTMEDISRRTGCSPATISRILNNSAPVSPEIREAVLREIRRSGYQPRPKRRQSSPAPVKRGAVEVVMLWHAPEDRLATGHAAELRLRPGDLQDDRMLKDPFRLGYGFFRHIIDGIVAELDSLGHKASLQVRNELLAPEFLADVMQPDNAGILVMGEPGVPLEDFIACCNRPLVLVDLLCDAWPDVVTVDNAGGIRQSFQHLRTLGHRDIGLISNAGNPGYREREAAFRALMAGDGLPVHEEWVFEQAEDVEKTADGVAGILARANRPTAFLCVCDYAAMGVIRAANRHGLAVPEQLSVAGFDDMDAAALVTPALTTIRVSTEQIGRQAVRQLLVSQLGSGVHRQERGCEIRVRTSLVVRQSTAIPCR